MSRTIIILFLCLAIVMPTNAHTYELAGTFTCGSWIRQIRTYQENGKMGVLLEIDDYYEPVEDDADDGEPIEFDLFSELYENTEPIASDYPRKLWLVISPDKFTGFVSLLDRLFIAFNQLIRGEEEMIDISFEDTFDGLSTCLVADIDNEEGFYVRESFALSNIIISLTYPEGRYLIGQGYGEQDSTIDFRLDFDDPKEVSDFRDNLIKIVWGESF